MQPAVVVTATTSIGWNGNNETGDFLVLGDDIGGNDDRRGDLPSFSFSMPFGEDGSSHISFLGV
jgi:hypothetical protein